MITASLYKLVSTNDRGEYECPDGSSIGELIAQSKIPFDPETEKVIRVHLPEDGQPGWAEDAALSDEIDYDRLVGYIIVSKTFVLYEQKRESQSET